MHRTAPNSSSQLFLGAVGAFTVLALNSLPACAQPSPSPIPHAMSSAPALLSPETADYVPPKVLKLATSSSPTLGPGTVVVEVLVRADGTFAVQRIIKSSNHENDQAALDIARRSSYKPASKAGMPIVSTYDVTLNFAGNGLNRYEQMIIGSGAYTRAKSELEIYVAKHPNDARARLDLGIAESFMNDSTNAVTSFDKAGVIPEKFKPIAAKAYSDRAFALSTSKNFEAALDPAKKAVQLAPGYETFNALAFAELGANDAKAAVPDFEKARALAESGKASPERRATILANLAAAYAKLGEQEKAKTFAAQAKHLDASAIGGYAAIEHEYVDQANTSMTAGKYAEAAALFEQAAEIAPSDVAVLYTNAAFAHLQEKPKAANDKAKIDADKALAMDAKNAGANFAAGIALANQGKRQDALAYLGKADQSAKVGKDAVLTANIEKTIQQLSARKR